MYDIIIKMISLSELRLKLIEVNISKSILVLYFLRRWIEYLNRNLDDENLIYFVKIMIICV